MHEQGIARDLWSVILNAAKKNKLKTISNVKIIVGEGTGIEISLLEHSFIDHIFPDTIASQAKLGIVTEKVQAKCRQCGKNITSMEQIICPTCQGKNWDIISGQNVYIDSIEGDK